MFHLSIISASVRTKRRSNRVAVFFEKYITDNKLATVEILDLNAFAFPVFNERLRFQTNPSDSVLLFAEKIKQSDGIIIVTPEYNGGYPASIKNIIDLLSDEWYRKPIAIATVSDGQFGGTQVITSLLFTLWKIKAWVVPSMFPVPKVEEAFDENGIPKNITETEKRAARFIKDLFWCIDAVGEMKKRKEA